VLNVVHKVKISKFLGCLYTGKVSYIGKTTKLYPSFELYRLQNMTTFGKRLRNCREDKNMSQNALATELGTYHSVIGRYERDEMIPSIDVAKKMSRILGTTVGYLIGEVEKVDTFRDPIMLKRLQEINALDDKDKQCILYTIDGLLRDAKTRKSYE